MKRILFSLLILLSGCTHNSSCDDLELTSINIIDHNGLSQTITAKERLKQFENVDFLQPSPYQKVMRVYARDDTGNAEATITSYHPNGQLKQYLETANGRAQGAYREWYSNSQQKLEAYVIGGAADIDAVTQKDWLFDGISKAWNDEGHLAAEIPYQKGLLEGTAIHYHPTGQIQRKIPYIKNSIHGTEEEYDIQGSLIAKSNYNHGILEGSSMRYWEGTLNVAAEELFHEGLLETGRYTTSEGASLTSIDEGTGQRALFHPDGSYELQEFHNGLLEGKIEEYNSKGRITQVYHIKEGLKQGLETYYYPDKGLQKKPKSKVLIPWYQGKVQGVVKSWYENGQLESQREFSENSRHGLSTAYYSDGSLMLIEEYEHDKLIKGEYHRKDDGQPVSRIIDGKGTCTLFDDDGSLLRKIAYQEGKPVGKG